MSSTGPPLPPDEDHTAALLGTYWAPFVLSAVVIFLRFYIRIRTRQLGQDDWWMLVAWIDYIAFLGIATAICTNGGCRHIFYIPLDKLSIVLELTEIVQPFSIFSSTFSKTSVTFLWTRLLNPQDYIRKYILWANLAVFWALSIAGSLMVFLRCSPPSLLWNGTPEQMAQSCINPYIFTDVEMAVGSYSAFSDLFLAVFPISIVWGLKLNKKKKLGICALLGLGIFTAVCAIVKTAYLQQLASTTDPTFVDFPTFLWASLESFMLIFCGSVPTIKPLWDRFYHGKSFRPGKRSYQQYPNASDHSSRKKPKSNVTSILTTNRGDAAHTERPSGASDEHLTQSAHRHEDIELQERAFGDIGRGY